MSYVGDCDLGMQLSETALRRLLRGQHAAGALLQRGIRYEGGWRYDCVVNAPEVSLQVQPGTPLGVRLGLRLLVHRRPAADASSVGESCVLDAELPVEIKVGDGEDPEPIDPDTRLYLDFGDAAPGDAILYPAGDAADAAWKLVRGIARELSPQSVKLPALVLDGQPVRSLCARSMHFSGERYISVGLNVRPSSTGNSGDLVVGYAQRDWAIAISPSYFLSRLRAALRARLPLPYQLSRRCTVPAPWPFSGCWNHETARLRSLTVDLAPFGVQLHGRIHVRNTGELIPDLHVTFDVHIFLSIDNQGDLRVDVGAVIVNLNAWFADVLDFVSGGFFKNKISEAIREAIQTNVGGSLTGLITPAQLSALVSLGSPSSLEIELKPRSMSVTTQGVVVHGDLSVSPQFRAPEANLSAVSAGDRRFVFYAVESIAPGSTIQQYRWKHADGTVEVFSGTSARFVTEKAFGAIPAVEVRDTCLRVTDDRGQVAETCIPPLTLPPPRIDSLLLLGTAPPVRASST